jgi:hypothetical protein
METYSLSLALEDFVPVILSATGLFIVARMVARLDTGIGRMAYAGFVLVSVGGLLKATWKLIMALTDAQTNIVWMDKGMFLWMAPGFLLLAFAVWYTGEIMMGRKRTQRIWLAPGVMLALVAVALFFTGFPDPEINTWRFILLGVMTLSNIVLVLLLIQKARHFGMTGAALLFLLNIVLVFVLNGMARMPEQTIPLQWTEQLLNTAAQGAFLLAAWQLNKRVADQDVPEFAVTEAVT